MRDKILKLIMKYHNGTICGDANIDFEWKLADAILSAFDEMIPEEKEVKVPTLEEPDYSQGNLILSAMNDGFNQAVKLMHQRVEGK